jgi:cardiolipin synthase
MEAGIRVFEWNGPMLHAKTAVADSRWARVGSSNLNVASWMGNWELDVAIEDANFAREMERTYEADLANSTEILLGLPRRRARGDGAAPAGSNRAREGSAVATAGAIRMGNTVSAALGGHRVLRPAEASVLVGGGLGLVAFGTVALLLPWVLVIPVAIAAIWLGITLIINGARLRRARTRLLAPEAEGRATRLPGVAGRGSTGKEREQQADRLR